MRIIERRYHVGERIKALRSQTGLSQEILAHKVGKSLKTLWWWEQGTAIKDSDCRALARALGVSFEELVGEPGGSYSALPPGAEPLPTRYIKVPLLGHCPASEKTVVNDEVLAWEYLPREIVCGQRVYLLKIKGDSMNRAGIDDGDRVVVCADQQPDNGDVTVVLVDGECTLKRWHRTGHTITLVPDSTNPKHQPQTFTKANDISVRGVVRAVWMKRVR